MDNLPASATPDKPASAKTAPVRFSRPTRIALMALAVIAALVAFFVACFLLFAALPSVRKPVLFVGCSVAGGRPVITDEFCGTSYKCLSSVLPALDVGSSCGDDLSCAGACENRKEVKSEPDMLGLDTCLPQFGCDKYQGRCSATRSIFSYFARQPNCGL